MKKLLYLFILLCVLPFPVFAKNHIYSIDMNIYLNQDGSANITEKWVVNGSNGTEWYKVINDLDNNQLTNFKVSMDNEELVYKKWDVNQSLEQKKGYYGINYTSSGLELCFGKYDYKKHEFILSYDIKDFITKTDDSDVLYSKLIDKLSDVDFDKFNVTVEGYYGFPDTLDVWGYGYKGYAYVENSKIYMSNEEKTDMNGLYVVLLAKFPLNTFTNDKKFPRANTFDEVLNMAKVGSYDYDYTEKKSFFDSFLSIVFGCLPFIIFFFISFITFKNVIKNSYGYRNNKIINKKDVPNFRDVPCNKDIYYANALMSLNKFSYKETNIFGAILLKWLKEDKIKIINETKGIFNKDTTSIDLTLSPAFDNTFEKEIFDMMYIASKDGILQSKELSRWARNNYTKFFNIFKNLTDSQIAKLKDNGSIYERHDKNECKYKNVMNDTLYDDSVKLYGLKKFLLEFSDMDEKTAIEVKLWDEYLMFAYLFGIADKVAKQFKRLYPEIVTEMDSMNYDYNTVLFVHDITSRTANAASSARSSAESYSSGGGGFSSGGGGGGSFGGGGGGSR